MEASYIRAAIAKIVGGADLTQDEARAVMAEIMDGLATPAQIGGLLTALRMKGETVEEIVGFAETMRDKAIRLETPGRDLLDTCGTGGDGAGTLNVSTAAAIVAAAGGVRVAKHGNRAMSSRSGSADVLEALGLSIELSPEQAAACLEQTGFCFLFAPLYHRSMRHAAAPRKEIGIRTVFNLLGPLTNPAGADRQLLGLFDRSRTESIAQVLRRLGRERALVVAGHDGLDEISVCAPTQVTELRNGEIRTYDIEPEDLGLDRYLLDDIRGGDAAKNADMIRRVFDGEPGACRDIVLANAGACFYVAGRVGSLRDGVRLAAETIDSGAARRKLEQLIAVTGAMRRDA